jgi:hypothetical protein
LEIRMHRLLLALATSAALMAGVAVAQQQVRISGLQIDELVELPPEMRLGVFLDLGDGARELGSARMVAGTFDLDTEGLTPEARDLRELASGSFPLAFMIGNEFVVDGAEGARFATAWLQPYHDQNDSGAYEELFDEWFFRAPPELTDPFGYFNLVYVDRDVVLRTTPAEVALREGWNLVVARVRDGALAYEVATSVSDVVVYSYGTNRTFENLDGPEDDASEDAAD